jgi:hypothetical protein
MLFGHVGSQHESLLQGFFSGDRSEQASPNKYHESRTREYRGLSVCLKVIRRSVIGRRSHYAARLVVQKHADSKMAHSIILLAVLGLIRCLSDCACSEYEK